MHILARTYGHAPMGPPLWARTSTINWRKYIQAKERVSNREQQAENTVEFISAEIEFSAELQESIDQGSIPLQTRAQ